MRVSHGIAATAGIAAALTVATAWPIVLAPTELIFGVEIVGRHHDPFTVMRQMAGAGPAGPYVQPLTDWTGWLLARWLHPVAAYNLLVLATFPLTAATAYALARHVGVPHVPALAVSLLFAFGPPRMAHAAYHPHIAQTQWLPLYFLALVATVDRPSAWRMAGLAAAGAALVLSNFYAGLMGAVVTPVALLAYWWTSPRAPCARNLWTTAGGLAVMATAAATAAWIVRPQLLAGSVHAFGVSEIPEYSARWWAYFAPPVTHAVFGPAAAGTFDRAGITTALVEQQIFVGYALFGSAMATAAVAWRRDSRLRPALGLCAIALAATLVSLGPFHGDCTPDSWIPACRIHAVLPMFRAYARFAFVTHLMLALAAGIGLAALARTSRAGRIAAVALGMLAAFEYWPQAVMSRDVLPTAAHRWLAGQGSSQHTLDCTTPLSSVHVPWLMPRRLTVARGAGLTCRDPGLAPKLAALGFTHAIVSRPDKAGILPLVERDRAGLTRIADFPDSSVYAVSAAVPPIVVVADRGFFEYEYEGDRIWRWMGAAGHWTIRNTTSDVQQAALTMLLESVHESRQVQLLLDGVPAGALDAGLRPAAHGLGPWLLTPGDHALVFRASGQPFRPSAHGIGQDDRPLTIAFRAVEWRIADRSDDGRPR